MLTLQIQGTEETISFEPSRLLIAGFTGRNQAWIQAHMDELRAHGIAVPTRVPLMFPLSPHLVTTDDHIHALGDQTSGEAEFAIIQHRGTLYIAAGSDHTDRELEKHSIPYSKQLCAKVISREVWAYADVREHWDAIELRGMAGERHGYQRSGLADMLRPEQIQALAIERLGLDPVDPTNLDDSVIFSGTPAIADGLGFALGLPFATELNDPTTGRSLRCSYRLEQTPLVDPMTP
jgi:hypothetical protein